MSSHKNNCWSGGMAIDDDFRRTYRMRAQDMDGFARNFIELATYLNDRVIPLLATLAERVGSNDEFGDEIKALEQQLNICVRRQYVHDPTVISRDVPVQYSMISDKLADKLQRLVDGPVKRAPDGIDAVVYNDRLRR